MRIAITPIMQESNTFSPVMTHYGDFSPVFGPAVLGRRPVRRVHRPIYPLDRDLGYKG
jgi:microcystin degradation protein MlrC